MGFLGGSKKKDEPSDEELAQRIQERLDEEKAREKRKQEVDAKDVYRENDPYSELVNGGRNMVRRKGIAPGEVAYDPEGAPIRPGPREDDPELLINYGQAKALWDQKHPENVISVSEPKVGTTDAAGRTPGMAKDETVATTRPAKFANPDVTAAQQVLANETEKAARGGRRFAQRAAMTGEAGAAKPSSAEQLKMRQATTQTWQGGAEGAFKAGKTSQDVDLAKQLIDLAEQTGEGEGGTGKGYRLRQMAAQVLLQATPAEKGAAEGKKMVAAAGGETGPDQAAADYGTKKGAKMRKLLDIEGMTAKQPSPQEDLLGPKLEKLSTAIAAPGNAVVAAAHKADNALFGDNPGVTGQTIQDAPANIARGINDTLWNPASWDIQTGMAGLKQGADWLGDQLPDLRGEAGRQMAQMGGPVEPPAGPNASFEPPAGPIEARGLDSLTRGPVPAGSGPVGIPRIPAPGAPGDQIAEMQAAADKGAAGYMDAARVMDERNRAASKVQEDAANQQARDAKAYEDRRAYVQQGQDQMMKNLIDTQAILNNPVKTPDPERYWNNHSKIMFAVGVGLLAQAGKDINGVLSNVNSAIDRDVEQQKQEFEAPRKAAIGKMAASTQLYGMYRDMGHDAFEAQKLASATLKDQTATQMALIDAKSNSDLVHSNAATSIAKLRMDSSKEIQDAMQHNATVAETQYGHDITQRGQDLNAQMERAKFQQARAAAGAAISDADAKKLSDSVSGLRELTEAGKLFNSGVGSALFRKFAALDPTGRTDSARWNAMRPMYGRILASLASPAERQSEQMMKHIEEGMIPEAGDLNAYEKWNGPRGVLAFIAARVGGEATALRSKGRGAKVDEIMATPNRPAQRGAPYLMPDGSTQYSSD